MADASTASGADPEDRIFMFRQPIVSTATRKTADNVEVMLNHPTKGPQHLVGPLQIMPSEPIEAAQGQAGAPVSASFDAEGRRASEEKAPNGCILFEYPLMDGFVIKPFPDITFKLYLHPLLVVGGSIGASVTFGFDLFGEICMEQMSLKLTPTPSVRLRLIVEIFVELLVIRGGLRLDADLLGIRLEPTIGMSFKSGFDVAGKIDLVLEPIKLCLSAFVELFWLKWCCSWGVCIPCGFTWKAHADLLLTTYYLHINTCYSLLTTYYLLLATGYLLLTTGYLLLTTYYLLLTLPTTYYLLLASY
jgi:hypothetical protein